MPIDSLVLNVDVDLKLLLVVLLSFRLDHLNRRIIIGHTDFGLALHSEVPGFDI